MGNYEQLKQAVSDVIKSNGNQEITGAILQNALLTIISTIGDNATFIGIAKPDTNPGTPDQNVFYLASQSGVYANFDGVELKDEVLVFTNKNGGWSSVETGIPTYENSEKIQDELFKSKGKIARLDNNKPNLIDVIEKVFSVTDGSGNIMFYIDGFGFFKCKYDFKQYQKETDSNNIFEVTDTAGNLLFYVDNNGFFKANYDVAKNTDSTNIYEVIDVHGNLLYYVDEDGFLRAKFKQENPGILINVPDKITSYVGDVIQIFKYAVTLIPNYRDYSVNFSIDSTNNSIKKWCKTLERYCEIIPLNTGNYTVLIDIFDSYGNFIEQGKTIIDVIEPQIPSHPINVLFLGDSETAGSTNNSGILDHNGEGDLPFPFSNEVKGLLSNREATETEPKGLNITNINLIGRKNISGGRNEGRGGWNTNDYLTSPNSPFVFNGIFNLQQYLAQDIIYDNTQYKGVDYFFILLGVNDGKDVTITNGKLKAVANTYKEKITKLLLKIKEQIIDGTGQYANPNLKVVLLNYASPYLSGRGYHPYGSNYYADGVGTARTWLADNEINDELVKDERFSSFLSTEIIAPFVDSENGYVYILKQKNKRMTETEKVSIEQVHFNRYAYAQYGEQVVRVILKHLNN